MDKSQTATFISAAFIHNNRLGSYQGCGAKQDTATERYEYCHEYCRCRTTMATTSGNQTLAVPKNARQFLATVTDRRLSPLCV
jgi:hypothetical protein